MPSLSSKRLYIRGIAKDVIEDDLFKYLSRYGRICEVKMLSSYTFVQFESEEDASRVLETYKTQPLLGKRVIIEFAHPLRKDIPSVSSSNSSPKSYSPYKYANVRHPVVVLGLPRDLRWQELKDFGRSSGMLVAYCDLDKTEEGRGFIEFFNREDAQCAVRVLNGRRLGGRKVHVIDHEELRDFWSRGRSWDRHPRSHKRQLLSENYSQVHDRPLPGDLSARQVYSPVRRMPDIDSASIYPEYRLPESCVYSMASSIAYEEPCNWSYNVEKSLSPPRVSFQHQVPDYAQLGSCYNLGAYNDGSIEYDSHKSVYQFQGMIDPYQ